MKTYHIVLAVLAAILLGVTAQPFPVLPFVCFLLLAFKVSSLRRSTTGDATPLALDISWVAVFAPIWVPLVLGKVLEFITGNVANAIFPTLIQIIQQIAVTKGPLT